MEVVQCLGWQLSGDRYWWVSVGRLSKIVREHLPILHVSEKLKQAVPNPPLVAYRRPYNLRDLLVRAAVQRPAPPTTSGNVPCNCKRCKTCQLIPTNTYHLTAAIRGIVLPPSRIARASGSGAFAPQTNCLQEGREN